MKIRLVRDGIRYQNGRRSVWISWPAHLRWATLKRSWQFLTYRID